MALRELSSLEKYLGIKKPNKYSTQGDNKVPVLQNNNGPPLVGLVTIACHLVKEAKRPELLGDSGESRAVVQQWLEYRVTKLSGCTNYDIRTILKREVGLSSSALVPFGPLPCPSASAPSLMLFFQATQSSPIKLSRDKNCQLHGFSKFLTPGWK
ncbi:eukaryotic translation elongation factor 1 epsilon-1 isoform X2 [Xiphias gladius]|uniref:eukaryotic translation elongation factor 1 epsilon-1 isoform X2 n=1 Tax=Xiphias gladius TaxID=8245 RepID=UPI001A98A2CE|nr:eukaryotic translation elongation factor 1 epsilon-1 isoform X2 [Xiphias gladius]